MTAISSFAPAGKVLPALAGFFCAGFVPYYFISVRKSFGGTVPSTLNNTWADATVERSKLSPREGSETPIKLNPIHGTKK